jgi:hypothetical protein
MCGQRHAPNVLPILQDVEEASGLVWTAPENLAQPGFEPRTIQPLASRYTGSPVRNKQ